MKIITASVIEELAIEKIVEVEVEDDATHEEIKEAIRVQAYAATLNDPYHGWEATRSDSITITFDPI